jgi:hypothetical protein
MANPNMRALRLAVRELDGEIVSSRSTGKHWLVIIKTAEGKIIRATLSKSPMRDGHVRFWIRQKFQRSKRKPKVKEK